MKTKKSLVALLITGFLLTACNDKTPNCSAKETKDKVFQIVKEKLRNGNIFFWSDHVDQVNFDMNNIRTQQHNKDVDSYICQSDLHINIDTSKIENYFSERKKSTLHSIEQQYLVKKSNIENSISHIIKEIDNNISTNEENKILTKDHLEKRINELNTKITKFNDEWKSRYSKQLLDLENSQKSYLSSGGSLDEGTKRSFELDREAVVNAFEEQHKNFMSINNKELESLVQQLESLDIDFEKTLQENNSYLLGQKKQLEQDYLALEDQLENSKREQQSYLDNERNSIENGLKLPIVYKIESSDDGKNLYIQVE